MPTTPPRDDALQLVPSVDEDCRTCSNFAWLVGVGAAVQTFGQIIFAARKGGCGIDVAGIILLLMVPSLHGGSVLAITWALGFLVLYLLVGSVVVMLAVFELSDPTARPATLSGWVILAGLLYGTALVTWAASGFRLGRRARAADRRLNRPRGTCRACGYDLTGNLSGRCSECGEPIDPPDADQNRAHRAAAGRAPGGPRENPEPRRSSLAGRPP